MFRGFFQWVSLSSTIDGVTKDRNCLNSSSLALESPLAFNCRQIKFLDDGGLAGELRIVALFTMFSVHCVLPLAVVVEHWAEVESRLVH